VGPIKRFSALAAQHRRIEAAFETTDPSDPLIAWAVQFRSEDLSWLPAPAQYRVVALLRDSVFASLAEEAEPPAAVEDQVSEEPSLADMIRNEIDASCPACKVAVGFLDQPGFKASHLRDDFGNNAVTISRTTVQAITRAFKYWLIFHNVYQKVWMEGIPLVGTRIPWQRTVAEAIDSMVQSVRVDGFLKSPRVQVGVTGFWLLDRVAMDGLSVITRHELGHLLSDPPDSNDIEFAADCYALREQSRLYPDTMPSGYEDYRNLLSELGGAADELLFRLVLPTPTRLPWQLTVYAFVRVLEALLGSDDPSAMSAAKEMVKAVAMDVYKIPGLDRDIEAEFADVESLVGFYASQAWQEALDREKIGRPQAILQSVGELLALRKLRSPSEK